MSLTMLSQCSLSVVCSHTLKEAPIDGVQCGDGSNRHCLCHV